MDDRIREQLLGYALGALDDSEQSEIEQRLAVDPELRRNLELVQDSLEPLADAYDEQEPPPGLAEKACAYVASEAERLKVVRPRVSFAGSRLEARSRWVFADWLVLAGICVAAMLLFFPAVLNSRYLARVQLCQDNLRQLGTSLAHFTEYAEDHCFPGIPTDGNRSFAGFYAPTLVAAGLLPLHRLVICPDSILADSSRCFRIPTIEAIDAAEGEEILLLQRQAGGSYASGLGVIVDGQHRAVKNRGRSYFAIMADSPLDAWSRPVHQHGQNILYEDQHISFVVNGPNMRLIDNPFCNRYGRCEAGVDADDAVVAPSDFPPIRSPAILSAKR